MQLITKTSISFDGRHGRACTHIRTHADTHANALQTDPASAILGVSGAEEAPPGKGYHGL